MQQHTSTQNSIAALATSTTQGSFLGRLRAIPFILTYFKYRLYNKLWIRRYWVSLFAALVITRFMTRWFRKYAFTPRRIISKTNPRSALNLEYRDVYFKTCQSAKIHGWFIPYSNNRQASSSSSTTSRGCVVLISGWNFNSENLLSLVPHIQQSLGYHCLLVEGRYHGKSEGDSDGSMNVYKLGNDLLSGVKYARTLKEVDPLRIGVVGFSYSAAAAIRVLHESSLVKFAVAVSGFSNYTSQLSSHWRLLGIPHLISDTLLRYTKRSSDFPMQQVSPVDILHAMDRQKPLLMAHGTSDNVIKFSNFTALKEVAEKRCLAHFRAVEVQNANHMNVVSNDHFLTEFNSYLTGVIAPHMASIK